MRSPRRVRADTRWDHSALSAGRGDMTTCSLWAKASVLKWTPEPRSHRACCRSAGAARFSTTWARSTRGHARTHTHARTTYAWIYNPGLTAKQRKKMDSICQYAPVIRAAGPHWAPTSTFSFDFPGLHYPSYVVNVTKSKRQSSYGYGSGWWDAPP